MAFKKMGLVIFNLGLALINGFMWYKNNEHKNYNLSSFNAFACGFCLCTSLAIFLNDL
tara:strand:+ start:1065 stop:1238 length:174 start_codon:yes stop_codon:yes gene_type:complete